MEFLSLTSPITLPRSVAYLTFVVLLRIFNELISETTLTNSLLPSKVNHLIHLFPFVFLKILIRFKFKIFLNIFHKSFNKTYPIRNKNIAPRNYSYPWITEGLVKCIKEKLKLHSMSGQNPVFKNDYIAYKNKTTQAKYFSSKL